ncbi:MAG: hypothetical protein FRX49_04567 [Trebouxia sp. A1-2]|nr:MAG: hypothetical protein FRX49_04567 [Trebouxia sp. A1-2]
MLVSQLAGVHWPVALLSSGFATVFISGRAKLFWKFGVANTVLLHLIRLCLGHAGALPLPGDKACDLFALSALAAAVSHLSSRNMHQSMGHWFMSGGLPSVRPLSYLCSTAGCSSSAVQLDGIAGDHGDVGAVVPDQDLASDAESEVFEEADAVMQPDLLHTEVPLQARQTAAFNGRGTDDFPGWRKPVAHLRAKLKRSSSIPETPGTTSDVSRLRTRRSVKERIRAVRRRATPACLSVQ